MLTDPVRSGQQVYAENSDLIVLAPVSSGAELIADGCIHVYGVLRGRAIAGATGNPQARIFCKRLEADLVAIAGIYMVADQIPKAN
jgi:septum site-determining protein MinC